MALKRSRRKRPSKDDYVLKEELKIEQGMFDTRTVLRLGKLFTGKIISSIHFITARGKEADIYIADAGSKVDSDLVIVKIFRVETSAFQRRMIYVTGDPRFGKVKKNMYAVVNEWCKKEYSNLLVAESAGVHAPKPYAFSGNVLAMEFIGSDGVPARSLKDSDVKDPDKALDGIISDMKKLYAKELVHSDMSEYNILMKEETPYLIDFGQAVMLGHPEAMDFLRRDVRNTLTYFSKKYKINKDFDAVFAQITKPV